MLVFTLLALCSSFPTRGSAFISKLPQPRAQVVPPPTTTITQRSAQQPLSQKDNGSLIEKKLSGFDAKSRLAEALLSFNSSAVEEIMSDIGALRGEDPNSIGSYLEGLLVEGPDSNLPFWAKTRRIPLARFSKRARLGSLRRLLDLSSPSSEETDKEFRLQRRRRALLTILKELSSSGNDKNPKAPAVLVLEKKARRESRLNFKNEDLRDRVPEGLETPEYSVVSKGPSYEIRNYKPYSICSVLKSKPRPVDLAKTDAKVSMPEMKGASAFGALAGYLFGKNQQSTAMKMTTPVITSGADEKEEMSFVLPSSYWQEGGIENAPKPFPESGVSLRLDRGGERAVMMFGGIATKKEIDARSTHLLNDLAKDKEWGAVDGPVAILAYNDPFTPPWKRLNEVSIPVRRRQ